MVPLAFSSQQRITSYRIVSQSYLKAPGSTEPDRGQPWLFINDLASTASGA